MIWLALTTVALLIFAFGIWDEMRRTRRQREGDRLTVPLGHYRLGQRRR